jgi:hypothetical protein
MAKAEIGTYVVKAHARYVHNAGKWQPILCVRRLRSAPEKHISQYLNFLPAIFETETDAIRYGFMKGRALVQGDIMGLAI